LNLIPDSPEERPGAEDPTSPDDRTGPDELPVPEPHPFDRVRARGMIGWAALGAILGGAAAALAGGVDSATTDEPMTLSHPVMVGFMVFVYGWMLLWAWRQQRRFGVRLGHFFRGALPPVPPLAGLVGLVLLFSFASFWFSYELMLRLAPGLAEQMMEGPDLLIMPMRSAADALQNLAVFLMVVVVAPLVEELLFRGFLLNRWGRRWGLRTGIIASSALFAVLHMHWVGLFVFGVVMSLLYVATGSLWAPILAHALNNGIAFGLALVGEAELGLLDPGTLEAVGASGWTAGLMLLISAPLLWRWLGERWPAAHAPLPWDGPVRQLSRDPVDAIASGRGSDEDTELTEQDRAHDAS